MQVITYVPVFSAFYGNVMGAAMGAGALCAMTNITASYVGPLMFEWADGSLTIPTVEPNRVHQFVAGESIGPTPWDVARLVKPTVVLQAVNRAGTF